MTTPHPVPKTLSLSLFPPLRPPWLPHPPTTSPPPLLLSLYSISSLHKSQNIVEMSREACWYARRIVDVEHFRRRCLARCVSLFPSLSLPVFLSFCLSLPQLVVATEDLAARPSGQRATSEGTVCTVYLLPAISFLFSPRLVPSQATCLVFFPVSIVFISTCCLMFDRLRGAKACM